MLSSYEIASLAVKALDGKMARDIQILKTEMIHIIEHIVYIKFLMLKLI